MTDFSKSTSYVVKNILNLSEFIAKNRKIVKFANICDLFRELQDDRTKIQYKMQYFIILINKHKQWTEEIQILKKRTGFGEKSTNQSLKTSNYNVIE